VRDDAAPLPHTSTDDIIGRARRARTRRNAATVAGGVAVLALAVTGVTTLSGGSGANGGQQAAAGPSPMASYSAPPAKPTTPPLPVQKVDFSSTFASYQVGAYRVGPVGQVTDGYTQIPVYRAGETWEDDSSTKYPYAGATITAYDKDVFDTATFNAAGDDTMRVGDQYEVTVNGKPALARDFTYISPVDPQKSWVRTAIAWQYADGAWATLMPDYYTAGLSRDDAVRIAEGLGTAAKKDLKVPYHFGYLPKGWQVVGVTQRDAKTSTLVSEVFLHQGPVADPSTRIDEVLPGHLKISVMKGKPKVEIKGDGVHCFTGQQSCTIISGDYLVDLGNYGETLTDAQVKQIAEGLQFTSLADQKTWVSVTN
jgi:hypothetical protein